MQCAPAIGEGVARGPSIAQLLAGLPVAGAHALIHHAAVVAGRVAEEARRRICHSRAPHAQDVLPAPHIARA